MKVSTISVLGLFGRHDHTVNVFSDGLTYIHSANGCGKSTLIRMVSLLFSGKIKELAMIPFERVDISFSDGANMIVERSESGMRIQMQRNEIESELDEKELSGILRTTFIEAERNTVKRDGSCAMNAVEAYSHDLSVRLKEAEKHRKITVPPYDDSMSDDELVSRAKDLYAKLNFIRDAGIEADMPPGLRFPPSRYDLMGSRKEYADLIHGVSAFVEKNYSLSESVVVFRDIMNSFLSDKDMTVDGKSNIVFMMDNGISLPSVSLSSGERQLFIIFYRLLFDTAPSSFVMIDEPEISLHVSWQQRLGTAMKDIARLKDLQIVIATHSPQIVHNDWDLTNELRAGRA